MKQMVVEQRRTKRWMNLALGLTVVAALAACDDDVQPPGPGGGGGTSSGGGGPTGGGPTGGSPLGRCEGGDVGPCGTFVTSSGTTLQLGPYGAVMDANVGEGFENSVSALDGDLGCGLFAAVFNQDASSTASLLDIGDLDLKLYTVYRPANWGAGETYPVITWGNGTCAQPEGYGALLRYIASHGFIVVAPNSRYVGTGSPPPMRRALDFMFAANQDASSPYFGKVDTDKVGAMGHSQGSAATAAAARDPRVDAAILFNGGTSATKPFLAVSGDRDLGGTAASYRNAINRAPKAAFLFYHRIPQSGSFDGHLTLMTQPERVVEPATQWWKLILNNDPAAREWFVGTNCELCNQASDFEFGQRGL